MKWIPWKTGTINFYINMNHLTSFAKPPTAVLDLTFHAHFIIPLFSIQLLPRMHWKLSSFARDSLKNIKRWNCINAYRFLRIIHHINISLNSHVSFTKRGGKGEKMFILLLKREARKKLTFFNGTVMKVFFSLFQT